MTLVPGGDQDQGTMNIDAAEELRRAIVYFEAKGMVPPLSPANRGSLIFPATARAASTVGTGKHRRPAAEAVIAVVVARMTSTTTTAQPGR
jgi:hypothetical protein